MIGAVLAIVQSLVTAPLGAFLGTLALPLYFTVGALASLVSAL